MKAKITAPHGYKFAPDGHTVVHFDFGVIVEGAIAEMAILDGHATAFQDVAIETKIEAPAEIKATLEDATPAKAETKADTKKGRYRK